MIKAVIFDLDDTLISEREYIESGYKHISKLINNEYGIGYNEVYLNLMNLHNQTSKYVFNRFFDKYKIAYSQETIMKLVWEYRKHIPCINFYNDVIPCIELLKLKNIKLGIITDGYKESQKLKLNAVRAENYFDEIIITDELGSEYWKPHPKSFEIMKERFNVEFNEMIYIGDNPEKDFYISKIYPIKTVRIVRDGIYLNKSYLDDIKENWTISNLIDINNII